MQFDQNKDVFYVYTRAEQSGNTIFSGLVQCPDKRKGMVSVYEAHSWFFHLCNLVYMCFMFRMLVRLHARTR